MKKKIISNDVPLPSSGNILIAYHKENRYGRDNGTDEHQGAFGH